MDEENFLQKLRFSLWRPDIFSLRKLLHLKYFRQSSITTSSSLPISKERERDRMAEELSDELDRIFKLFDANGDGKISSAELGEALRTLGSTSTDEIQRMMAELDIDGDGYIDHDEYAAFCRANPGLMKDVAKIF